MNKQQPGKTFGIVELNPCCDSETPGQERMGKIYLQQK